MSTGSLAYRSAIRFALREELRRDDRVFIMGEDIGEAGGVFKVTEGLMNEFGPRRVIDTPISETAIVGAAFGAAVSGLVPVVELMFSDFAMVAIDQIANQVAKHSYLSAGREPASLVIRAVTGGGISFGPQHSQSLEAWFTHIPGLISILPSNPRDAKGLLKSAIRNGQPTMFFEHKALYPITGPVPEGEEILPIGKCEIKTEGNNLTIVSAGAPVISCLECAERLRSEGVHAEVIDLRTLSPLDTEPIFESVGKTGRLMVVEEDVCAWGWGAEVVSRVAEERVFALKGPIRRVGAPYSPIPFSPVLEKAYIPNIGRIYAVAKEMI